MTEQTVYQICNQVFHKSPVSIERNNVGLAGYVYTILIDDEKYVLKLADDKNLISGSIYWLEMIKDLEIPIPKVIAENIEAEPFYFVMNCIPGQDLGIVYNTLSSKQKKDIAATLLKFQKEIKKLPLAPGYGSLNSYDDKENLKNTWVEFIESEINRAEEGISQNHIFPVSYVNRVRNLVPEFKDYFSKVKPEPFFDDATTKNVLVHNGKLSGIIDLDWITFGDALSFIGLTAMALLSMNAELDYVEYLMQEMGLNEEQENVLKFYILIFCIVFMSEKGMCFNQNEPAKVSNDEIKHLEEVFGEYYERICADKWNHTGDSARLKQGTISPVCYGHETPTETTD
jgi:hypothetical protein